VPVALFQSTPTGFPAGDVGGRCRRAGGAVSIHADRFPGRRPDDPGLVVRLQAVSIHADRFPGRRPVRRYRPGLVLLFQSTPTGFPAGDKMWTGSHC
jgi:hypothetical protein